MTARPPQHASVFIRLRPDIFTALQAAALAAEVSAAGWARGAIVAALPSDIRRDIGSLPPSPRRRPVKIPSEDVAEVSRLVGSVGRTAGALIQLAKALRVDGHGHGRDHFENAVNDLRATQSDLVGIVARLRRAV